MQQAIAQEPKPHKITVAEYFRMGEIGVLEPEAKVELVEGEIIDMAPIGSPHASRVKRLLHLFASAIGDRAILSAQDPVILGDLSAPEPDLALLRPRLDFYAQQHPSSEDVLLVIEVADSSLRYDRERKIPLYARFAVPEVWLVDVNGRHLDVYRQPDEGLYTQQSRVDDLSKVGVSRLPGLELDLRRLF